MELLNDLHGVPTGLLALYSRHQELPHQLLHSHGSHSFPNGIRSRGGLRGRGGKRLCLHNGRGGGARTVGEIAPPASL